MKQYQKYVLGFVLMLGAAIGVKSFAIFPQDTKNQTLLSIANARDPLPGIGTIINQTKNMMRVTYDFSVLGGAATTIALVDDQGNTAALPKGAFVTNVVANVLTQPLPSTSSVSLYVLADQDLMATKAQSALTGSLAGVPIGTAATWKGPITATLGSPVNALITGSALTAGKIQWFIEYVIQ